MPFFVTAAVFVYAASRFLVLWKNELRGQSMAQAGLQDYAPAYTFGLSAGLFFGLSGAYSLPVALLTIILSRVTSYTRQLHGGVILFFLAGVALVWYAAD